MICVGLAYGIYLNVGPLLCFVGVGTTTALFSVASLWHVLQSIPGLYLIPLVSEVVRLGSSGKHTAGQQEVMPSPCLPGTKAAVVLFH